MDSFTRLFGSLLLFVYHCFEQVGIHRYLSGLSRPGQVAHFFPQVVGEPAIDRQVLSRRTNDYQAWVEAFAHNHRIPIEWAEAKAPEEDYVRPAVRRRFLAVTDRFAAFQAEWLHVHAEFPLLQRLALPIVVGATRFPGNKIHDPRMIRLMEVRLHGGSTVGGWTAKQIHQAILTAYQLRYDLRKMKAHGLVERDGRRYAYRLSGKGTKAALRFVLFHKQRCGLLANGLFHRRRDAASRPQSKLETAFHKADDSVSNIIQPLQAA